MSAASTNAALLFFFGGVALIVAALAMQRRRSTGALPLALAMFATLEWCWTYALHWLSPAWPQPLFWLSATYLGEVAAPVLVFVFVLEFTGQARWLRRRVVALLALEPLLALLLVWTDPLHGLFFGSARATGRGALYQGGPAFWVNVAYGTLLLLGALALLVRAWRRMREPLYRHQIALCMLGLGLSLALSLLGPAGLSPLPDLDLTPMLVTLSGLLLAASVFSYRILDLPPMALNLLLEHMDDGLLVLDRRGRVVEINRAAAALAGMERAALIGQPYAAAFPDLPEMQAVPRAAEPRRVLVHLERATSLDLAVDSRPLPPVSGQPAGWLLTWRDVSASKRQEEEVFRLTAALEERSARIHTLQEELHDQAIRDPLTGLYNRRYLEEALTKELARADRLGTQILFLMIDIDHFKEINDAYGHELGDVVLQQLGAQLERSTRKGDLAARFGGEEFLLALVDADPAFGFERAEQLRRAVQVAEFGSGEAKVRLTISTGLSSYPTSGSDLRALFRAADQALYKAKLGGRNKSVKG